MKPTDGYALFKQLHDLGLVSRFTLEVLIAIANERAPPGAYWRALKWAIERQLDNGQTNHKYTVARAARWLAHIRQKESAFEFERQCRQLRTLFHPRPERPPP